MKKIVLYIAVVAAMLVILLNTEAAIYYSRDAIALCVSTIVPSLFPFFILSSILIYSGFSKSLSIVFAPIMTTLFGVGKNSAPAFILGLIGGYPLGAVTCVNLYKSNYISKDEAERVLAFSNNSGPLFILGSIGVGLFSNVWYGVMLYASHLLSAVLVGIVLNAFSKPIYTPPTSYPDIYEMNIGELFSKSISSGINSMLSVCACVVFFSCISNLALDYIGEVWFRPLIHSLLEFAGGSAAIVHSGFSVLEKLIYCAFATGFAGFCVHLQVIGAVSDSGLSIYSYVKGKLLHGIFSAVFITIILAFCKFFTQKTVSFNLGYGFWISSLFILTTLIIVFVLLAISKSTKQRYHHHPL